METKLELETKQIIFPADYKPKLDFFETQKAIKFVKDAFEREIAEKLCLQRVTAPRFLIVGTGLQDDLAGTQIPVSFVTKFAKSPVEVVHSLAKWKRHTLGKQRFKHGTGLYTDMDAIRKDEEVDETHSIYVDQWDWERVISKEERIIKFLKETVKKIYSAMLETEKIVEEKFPALTKKLPDNIVFIHTEELEKMYPWLSPREREKEITKKYGAVFLIGIGHPLASGEPHDLRAADYDDWSTKTEEGMRGLNGDIIVWDAVREDVLELSSMGIRVDAEAMERQLHLLGVSKRKEMKFQKAVIEEKLPLSIGGGIGQSRLCMLLLQKAHIGEVQSSVWPEEVVEEFERRQIALL